MKYLYLTSVEADSKEEADLVMTERVSYDEDYGFEYRIREESEELQKILPDLVNARVTLRQQVRIWNMTEKSASEREMLERLRERLDVLDGLIESLDPGRVAKLNKLY